MESIAIIGIGCRFPQANSPQAFWELLRSGQCAIRDIPTERWPVDSFYHPDPQANGKMSAKRGGFIDDVDRFDASFFGISEVEAQHIDPQQRLFLEVAWEALEHAGIAPLSLGGSSTGVFTGLCTIDYHRLLYKDFDCIGPHSGTGTTMSITANRLSYLLDLRGPSMAIDAACASSLLSVHLACQSLKTEEANLCIVGGVNLILSPDSMISSSQTGLLSKRGECRPFDSKADGYVRGEGCGVVILKRLSDALQQNDPILAVIKGSATNQDGLSNSLTAPNGLAQQALLQQAMKAARVQPQDIDYIEAHAVGTPLGDAIEFKALQKAIAAKRQQPCILGSVKPNIGHLEAASGIAALIKVVLSLHHEEIPPQLNFEQANQYVDLESGQFEIRPTGKAWPRQISDRTSDTENATEAQSQPLRVAGISTFGFGGSNAHVILSEAPLSSAQMASESQTSPVKDRPCHAIALTAKSPAALRQLAQRYSQFLKIDSAATQKSLSLPNICFTTNTGRSQFAERLYLISDTTDGLQQQLAQFSAIPHTTTHKFITSKVITGKVKGRKRPKLVFYVPEPTVHTLSLGQTLYQTQPTFRQAFDQCAQLINGKTDLSLALMCELESDESSNCVKGFAICYALATLWQSWGVYPKAVCGQGLGEYVAACISGLLKIEEILPALAAEPHFKTLPMVFYAPRLPLLSLNTDKSPSELSTQAAAALSALPNSHKLLPKTGLAGYDTLLSIGVSNSNKQPLPASSLTAQEPVEKLLLQTSTSVWPQILNQLGQLFIKGIPINWKAFDDGYLRDRIPLPTYPFERSRHWFTPRAPDTASTKGIVSEPITAPIRKHSISHIPPQSP